MTTLAGNILTPQGFIHGSIEFSTDGSQRGRISKISGQLREAMTIRDDASPIIVPDGERYKQTPTVMRVYDALIKANAERNTTLITFGAP